MTTAQRTIPALAIPLGYRGTFPGTVWALIHWASWYQPVPKTEGRRWRIIAEFQKIFWDAIGGNFEVLEWYRGLGPVVKTPSIISVIPNPSIPGTVEVTFDFTIEPWVGTFLTRSWPPAPFTELFTTRLIQSSDTDHFFTLRASLGGRTYQLARPTISSNTDAYGFTFYTYEITAPVLRAAQIRLKKFPRTQAPEDIPGFANPLTDTERIAYTRSFPRMDRMHHLIIGDPGLSDPPVPTDPVINAALPAGIISFTPQLVRRREVVGVTDTIWRTFLNTPAPGVNPNDRGTIQDIHAIVYWTSDSVGNFVAPLNHYQDRLCDLTVVGPVGSPQDTLQSWDGSTPDTFQSQSGKFFSLPMPGAVPSNHRWRIWVQPLLEGLANDGTTFIEASQDDAGGPLAFRAISEATNC